MKLIATLKYQLQGFWCLPIVYLGFCALAIGLCLTHTLDNFSSSGYENIPWFVFFFGGFILFKTDFKLFSANGVSRRTFFCSLAIEMGIAAAAMSLIITLNTILLSHFINYHSSFAQLYYGGMLSDSQSTHYTFQMLAQQFLWQTFGYFLVAMIGLFITALYYRMNKGAKIAVSIGVPVLCFLVYPMLDFGLWGGRLSYAWHNFYDFAWGYSNGYNPYIGMASMVVFAAVNAALAWLLIRRANVKA